MDVPSVIEGKRKYAVKEKLYSGDLADLYACTYGNGSGPVQGLIKIARDPQDSDLLANEAAILSALNQANHEDKGLYLFLPKVIDSVRLRDRRQVNVLPHYQGYLSLSEIIAAYPEGIDYRDMIWMYKRVLVGIGFAHSKGFIHGAIVPPHVLVHPTEHGARVLDWSYALNFNLTRVHDPKPDPTTPDPTHPAAPRTLWERLQDNPFEEDETPVMPADPVDPNKLYIRALCADYDTFYPPEVFRKQTPSPALDIYMAAKCMIVLLGGNPETNELPDRVPTQIKAFLSASLMASPSKRPSDAWQLHEDFEKLIVRLLPKAYRVFRMPQKRANIP